MSAWEKNSWILLGMTVAVVVVYISAFVFIRNGKDLVDVDYQLVMASLIGLGTALGFLLAWLTGGLGGERDERDIEIERLGDRVGQAFFVVATLGSLVLAMFEVHHFWIAHLIFGLLAVSGILASLTRLAAYRGDFQQW